MGTDSVQIAAPTTLMWALYFLAQHYDYSCQREKALEVIDEVRANSNPPAPFFPRLTFYLRILQAIVHTPTALELYWCKSRILKHRGSITYAANTMARSIYSVFFLAYPPICRHTHL